MPVVAERTVIANPNHRLSITDLPELPAELPSGPVLYELNDGKLVVAAAPSALRGAIDFKLSALLFFEGEKRGFGKAILGDVALVLWRDPDRLVVVDAVFYCKDRLPVCRCEEGCFLKTIPDLVVEVRSEDDSPAYLQQKVEDLHRAGVRLVLLIDPEQKCIVEARPGQPAKTLAAGDTLQMPDIIPHLEVKVAELFEA